MGKFEAHGAKRKTGSQMAVKQKILLVEDDDALAEVLGEQLALHEEFELARVATASEALAQAGNGFDLILLDVGLPDQDGRETCKIIRKNKITSI